MTTTLKILALTLATLFFCLVPTTYTLLAANLLDESEFLIDLPTVTSATRFSQHLSDAPVSMTVIDRAMIQASGAQNIPDLFRLVPGFQVAHVNSNKFAVTYHGHSDDFPRRLEVMVDGRSVYMPFISSPDWTSLGIHLDDIEKIEVIRGSNTATHGSNAFIGAINIITRHPSTESNFSAAATLGSLETQNTNLRFNQATEIGHYRVSYGHEKNKGSKQFSDGARRNYLNFTGSFMPTIQDQLEIRAGIDRGYTTIGALKANKTPDSIVTRQRDYESNFQHITWNRTLNNRLSLQLDGYRNELSLNEQRPTLGDVFRYSDYDVYQLWLKQPNIFDNCAIFADVELNKKCNFVSRMINSFHSTPTLRLYEEQGKTRQEDLQLSAIYEEDQLSSIIGAGFRRDLAEGRTLFDAGNVNSIRYRLFINSSYKPHSAVTLNLGAMYEKEESRSEATSLRGALNYHLTNHLTFRTGLSHSERLPSLYESYGESTLYFNGFDNEIYNAVRRPNSSLKPEVVFSKEFGVLYNFSNNNGSLDIRIFDEDISKGIETFRTSSSIIQNNGENTVRIEQNISSWTNRGSEVQFRFSPLDNLWLLLNYAYINSTKDGFNNGTRFIQRRQLAPRHTASALINWRIYPDVHLSAAHYYIDQMHWLKGATRDAYHRTDLRIAKDWSPHSKTQFDTALVVQNAFGPSYKEFYDYHDFERRIFVTFRLKYD